MITGTLLRTEEITPRMLRLTFAVPGCERHEAIMDEYEAALERVGL